MKKTIGLVKKKQILLLCKNSLQDLGESFKQYYQKKKGKPKFKKQEKNEVHSYTSKCNYSKSGPTIRMGTKN
ncbi:hypothetical protein GCM10020331_101780 [Ectobacillus funiculus]